MIVWSNMCKMSKVRAAIHADQYTQFAQKTTVPCGVWHVLSTCAPLHQPTRQHHTPCIISTLVRRSHVAKSCCFCHTPHQLHCCTLLGNKMCYSILHCTAMSTIGSDKVHHGSCYGCTAFFKGLAGFQVTPGRVDSAIGKIGMIDMGE